MDTIKKYGLGLIAFSAAAVVAFVFVFLRWHSQETVQSAVQEARDYYALNQYYRLWNASLGGVYAPVEKVTPNPYLKTLNRDVTTTDGKVLTLVNPAYMTSMVFAQAAADPDKAIYCKLISLNPLNPDNAPTPWEAEALRAMEQNPAGEYFQLRRIDDQEYLQFLGPFVTAKSCLKCHEQQGYREGDLRGAISISIPMETYRVAEINLNQRTVGALLVMWGGFSVAWAILSKRRHDKDLALQLSEERNRTIFETSQAGIFMVDPTGKITLANRSMAEMFDYPLSELIGMKYPELIVADERFIGDTRMFQLIRGEISGVSLERHYQRRDGSSFWGHLSGRRIEDAGGKLVALLGVIADVTPLRQAIDEVNQAKDYFFSILNAIADPVFVKDDQHRLILVNDAECRMLGRDRSEILGKTESDFFPAEQVAALHRYDDLVLQTGEPRISEEEITAVNGHKRIVLAHKSCYVDQSGQRFIVGSLRDITGQKALEHQAMRAAQLAAVGELASGVAHEINNPITGVINCAQLLVNRNAVDEQNKAVLARIIREGDRVAAIVKSLLFFSRDGGQDRVTVDIRLLLVDVLQLIGDQLAKEGIDLQLNLPEPVVRINANPQQIEQVMLNLLSNARHALNESGRVEKKLIITVDLVQEQNAPLCRIAVYDNGSGIAEDLLDRLGQPFVTTKPAGIGTGLGLSISQEIVKRHGGVLHIVSLKGEFTEVTVDLPAV